jgi:hypothetical protein
MAKSNPRRAVAKIWLAADQKTEDRRQKTDFGYYDFLG